jgi:hypothetical protein
MLAADGCDGIATTSLPPVPAAASEACGSAGATSSTLDSHPKQHRHALTSNRAEMNLDMRTLQSSCAMRACEIERSADQISAIAGNSWVLRPRACS